MPRRIVDEQAGPVPFRYQLTACHCRIRSSEPADVAPLVRPERRVLALNVIHFAARTVNRKVELDAMRVGFRLRAFTDVQKGAHLDRQAGFFEKLTPKALDYRRVVRFQSTTGWNPHLRARFGHFLKREQYPPLLIDENACRTNSMLQFRLRSSAV